MVEIIDRFPCKCGANCKRILNLKVNALAERIGLEIADTEKGDSMEVVLDANSTVKLIKRLKEAYNELLYG